MHDRPRRQRLLMAAVAALIQIAFCEKTILFTTAFRTDETIFPAAFEKVFTARIFAAKLFLKFRITDNFFSCHCFPPPFVALTPLNEKVKLG